jgi:hypothetical protein
MSRRIWGVIIGIEIVVMVLGSIHALRGPSPPQFDARTGSTAEQSQGALSHAVKVPKLRGMTALGAHARLLELGLELGKVRPTRGRAGVVVRTDPVARSVVSTGTRIDLFVGAHGARLTSATSASG